MRKVLSEPSRPGISSARKTGFSFSHQYSSGCAQRTERERHCPQPTLRAFLHIKIKIFRL
jgi:hypothetical protein